MRGPDFAVTYTTSTLFMVEVTRLRLGQDTHAISRQIKIAHSCRLLQPLAGGGATHRAGVTKLGQLPPQRRNVLLVEVDGPRLTPDTLRAAMIHLQRRAERNEDAYLQRHQFRDRADFFNHYQRLSEVLVRGPSAGRRTRDRLGQSAGEISITRQGPNSPLPQSRDLVRSVQAASSWTGAVTDRQPSHR